MYLKSLELHGFKSFPNRTVLTFERGATVIVGPNGSGKSNISDAMRWVLGELSSRNIRGTKMEDVIFGGTDTRRPMGFAEVSVTFDNSDPEHRLDSEYDEVTVTRRYFRTGESEYLINKQPRRLRDIYELFMNTGVGREGYSIIGQGKIAEIISKKSEERRNIFEEAAGISKYRHRKEESERKLKQTQDNLDRVNDILVELESRVGPLEKEADKARRGLAIYEEKKRADVSLWLFDTQKIRVDVEEAEKEFKLAVHELEIIDQLLADLELQENNLSEKSLENRMVSEQLLNKIRETQGKLHQLDSDLKIAESNYLHSAELIKQCRARIEDIELSKAKNEESRSVYEKNRDEAEKLLKSHMDTKLEYLSEVQKYSKMASDLRTLLQEALDELTVEENSATDYKIRIDVLKNSKVSDGTKSQDIENDIEKYEQEAIKLKAEADRCEKNASGFKAEIFEKDSVIIESNAKIDELTDKKSKYTDEYNRLKGERDSLIARATTLQNMNEHFEGYAESIKYVMQEYKAGNINGKIYGPLSSLINVNKEYITAIETALGASLQNIVVEDEATAKAAIYALKRNDKGRATFYPISAIKPTAETDEIRMSKQMTGFIGRADTLVKSDNHYRSIIEWLLLRTVVFDNIENASNAAKQLRYKVKIVTLDGQVINAGGAFTGGSAKRDSGILSRGSTIAALNEEANGHNRRMSELESDIKGFEAQLIESRDMLKNAEQEKEILLTLSRSQFSALDNANAKYNANNNIIEKLRYDYNNLIGQQSKAEEDIIRLTGEYNANLERIEALKEFRINKSYEMGVYDEKCDELNSKANEETIKIIEIGKDIENQNSFIDDINKRISELDDEKRSEENKINDYKEKRNSITSIRQQGNMEFDRLQTELDDLNNQRRDVENGSDEFEKALSEIRAKQRDKSKSRDVMFEGKVNGESRLTRLIERRDKLGSQLWDDYEITYEDAVALQYPEVNEENRDEIAAIQTSCRSKLRSLGNYNPGAIDEYAEVKTRYDALNTQYTDLLNSHKELLDIIARLEVEMRTSFVNAFEAINRNFGITFKELFGGGNAELLLTEPEDVLTSGIEIKAAPPGKIIKNMALLSGGEQSFVAIALLFAILKVNPTPFCILDEIESALDEVNVFRFGEYIKKFDDGTQFILITHRRGTMEVGDRLYGVTMPQRGISQAIELNVNEIEGRQKELLDGVL